MWNGAQAGRVGQASVTNDANTSRRPLSGEKRLFFCKSEQASALAFWPAVLARFDAERLDRVWLGTVGDRLGQDRF